MPSRWEIGGERENTIAHCSILGLSQTERVVDTDNKFVFKRQSPYYVSVHCSQGMRGILTPGVKGRHMDSPRLYPQLLQQCLS